jgi:hypothetical protein
MPIPSFDGILNALPPYLRVVDGYVQDMSPYQCTLPELCDRFATSEARKRILLGFLDFRRDALVLGIQGFQWLGGSFVENIEVHARRDPGDMDVVTFVSNPATPTELKAILDTKPELFDADRVKERYRLDHHWISLGSQPAKLVEEAQFWYGLYSHRNDQTWKGMLKTHLTDSTDDGMVRGLVEGKP